MRKFDLLFLLPLRDQARSVCDLDKMISESILHKLARRSRYTPTVLEDILHHSTCLVVLDGLDEWTHPEVCERGNLHDLPHIQARKRCSVLITSRSWKLDVLSSSQSKIDKKVEIKQLNKALSEQLVTNAVTVLNKRGVKNKSKIVEEFQEAISNPVLQSIRYIPYILLQMVCLWFDGKSIGNFKAEIYSNMIELALSRGLMKLQRNRSPPMKKLNIPNTVDVPYCLLLNQHCKYHYDVLLGLAKLAFQTLFSTEKESSVVFDRTVALEYIQKDTLDFSLKMGLLLQSRDYETYSQRRSNVSFQHKSIQEYFAALFIQSYPDNQDVRAKILKVCKTLTAILDVSNVFIFLGGLNPGTCGKILRILFETKEIDEIREFRVSSKSQIWPFSKYHENIEFQMAKYQTMLTNIMQEIKESRSREIPFIIEDVFIDENCSERNLDLLKPLIDDRKGTIKSLCLEWHDMPDKFAYVLASLGLQNVQSLQKVISEVSLHEDTLNRVLSGSVDSLKSLVLYKKTMHDAEYKEVSPETTNIVTSMVALQSISLKNVYFSHFDTKLLMKYLGNRTTIEEVALENVNCTKHACKCTEHCIDMSESQKLKLLKLDGISVKKIDVYTPSLKTCLLGKLTDTAQLAITKCLRGSANLSELRVCGATWQYGMQELLPTLDHLTSLFIIDFDLNDDELQLPEMKNIQDIRLSSVKMSVTALRSLTERVNKLQQPVTIKLYKCFVTPLNEYRQLTDEIGSSQKYDILDNCDSYFKYTTVK